MRERFRLDTNGDREEAAWREYEYGDPTVALSSFLALAKEGRPYYLVVAARMYLDGIGTAVSHAEARALLEQAMSVGVLEAFLQRAFLARMDGDHDASFGLLSTAVSRGHGPSRFYLGMCYMEGRGVPKNEQKGMALIRQASAEGYLGAQIFLARRILRRPESLSQLVWGLWLLLTASMRHLVLAFTSPHDVRLR